MSQSRVAVTGMGTVLEQRGRIMSAVGSRCQETGEDRD
jgi:hypothetical protein